MISSFSTRAVKSFVILAALLVTGCADFGVQQALGFFREDPNEFEADAYTALVVPPFIGTLPVPEYEQLSEIVAMSFSAQDNQQSPVAESTATTPQEAVRFFLGLHDEHETVDQKLAAQTQGLLYLSDQTISQLKNQDNQSARGIRIIHNE